MKRNLTATVLALALALILAVPVLAGGWAVITLDALPGQMAAGEPLEIGFVVRQHGQTPLGGLTPIITARLNGGSKLVRFFAEEQGAVGHYTASLTLPEAGTWEWSIEAFGEPQAMPALTVNAAVVAAEAQVTQPATAPAFNTMSLWIGVAGLVGAALGALVFRSKRRWAIALVLAGFLVGGYGVVSAANPPRAESDAKPLVAVSADSQVELGRQLFVAKGCVTCHYHSDVSGSYTFGFDDIPNLTNFTASPEYLRMWLTNPKSVKPYTKMPALGLSEAEIEALIAFINAD